jgi:hypothetical protein
MREVSNTINYKGKDYKIVFNLNVMEAIQEEYKTLDNWGSLTDGKGESGEVDIKALIFGFTEMLNEGIEISNEDNGTNEPLLTKKQVARILSDYGVENATNDINNVVIESTKSDSKNE